MLFTRATRAEVAAAPRVCSEAPQELVALLYLWTAVPKVAYISLAYSIITPTVAAVAAAVTVASRGRVSMCLLRRLQVLHHSRSMPLLASMLNNPMPPRQSLWDITDALTWESRVVSPVTTLAGYTEARYDCTGPVVRNCTPSRLMVLRDSTLLTMRDSLVWSLS